MRSLALIAAFVVLALLLMFWQQRKSDSQIEAGDAVMPQTATADSAASPASGELKVLVKPEVPTEGLTPEEQAKEALQRERARAPAGALQP